MPLVPTTFIRGQDRISTHLPVICLVKLLTPDLYDVRQALQEDLFDFLVQFGYPLVEVGVPFQIEFVDLFFVWRLMGMLAIRFACRRTAAWIRLRSSLNASVV